MKRALLTGLAAVTLSCAAGCGNTPPPSTKTQGSYPLTPLVRAFRAEAADDAKGAVAAYVDIARAASRFETPYAMAALDAALDALVFRDVEAFADIAPESALAFRVPDAMPAVEAGLADAYANAGGVFARGAIARALTALAEHRGDAKQAASWRAASGCAQEATVVGPVAWPTVTGVKEPDALDAYDAKLGAAYAAPGPFAWKRAPVVVRGRGCGIELAATASAPGVRDVVVDVDVPSAQTIGIGLRAHGAAIVRAGGAAIIDRPYELGSGDARKLAKVDVTAGKLRVVARASNVDDGDAIEIDAWDAQGKPLAMHAPAVGEAGSARALRSERADTPAPKGEDELLAFALAAIARGDAHTAERALMSVPTTPKSSPELALTYARAVQKAQDLSPVQKAERARGAYERVLEAWPGSWEATLAHAVLASVRRGKTEAPIEALRDLDARRARSATAAGSPLLDLYDAATSGREGLLDRATTALGRAAPLEKTSLYADVKRLAFPKVGRELVAIACAATPPARRDDLDCFDALRQAGDRPGAVRELDRLRAVRGAPDRFLPLALREAAAAGDLQAARAIFDAMLPGERTLIALHAIGRDAGDTPETRAMLRRIALGSKDAPAAIPPLLRSMGDDPAQSFQGVAESITAEDRAKPILPEAATAILTHKESYAIDETGLVHHLMLDVRRVSGTTDVEQNAQADAADIGGKTAMRVVRKRIFKKDGRVLEPDQTPRASQAHADLAQLEQGDYIEAIYEGWSLPGETGDITIDTPDLMPDRTGVHDATVVLRVPSALRYSLHVHPLLGKAQETADGGARVYTWSLKNKAARRLEDGVPRMDRTVGVSFSTLEWSRAARAMREQIASLDEHDPEIGLWARDAVREAAKGQAPGSRAMVEAIVDAAGKAVREAQGYVLTDAGGGRVGSTQSMTARTILTEHEGSRSWLIVRALRELGVPAEIVVAEDAPFSGDPAFPPHFGRFTHPLVIVHGTGEHAADIVVDADIAGPPLPAGRISPELRGRAMLRTDGAIAEVPVNGNGDGDRDEIDLRIALDASGNAKGSFTIMLRGRDAQELAEALFRIVGADRQRALRGVVLGWVPYANVDDVVLSSSEGSWQIGIRAEISVSGYAQAQTAAGKNGGATWMLPGMDPLHYVFPRPYVSALSSVYASQAARESALAINASIQYHAHRRVELPPGATIARMPAPLEASSSHLQGSRKLTVNGNVIEDDFALNLPTGTVPPAEYERFTGDAHKIDDAFLATTLVKPAP